MASKAEPDGYTLLSTTSSYPATAAVRAKLPFDPAKAIIPVATFARIGVINAAVNKMLASADMKKFLDTQGTEPWPQTPAQLAELLPKEIARYRKAMEVAGIAPQ